MDGRTLAQLVRVNRGAREAQAIGMSPEAVAYYATRWPNGIGVSVAPKRGK